MKTLQLFALAVSSFVGSQAIAVEAPCYFQCQEVPSPERTLTRISAHTEATLPADEIRILIWNVYKGGKPAFYNTFARLRDSLQPDLVILEEATTDGKVMPAMTSMPHFGWDLAASFLMIGSVPTGPVIGSRAIAHNVRFHRTVDREPVVATPKATIISEFEIEGLNEKLLVLGIHGINFTADDAYERQISALAAIIAKHQGPVVFAGDFNVRNPARVEMTPRILAKVGLKRAPWVDDKPNFYFQLDDAYTRGLDVGVAQILRQNVEGTGSDHPALFLKLYPRLN